MVDSANKELNSITNIIPVATVDKLFHIIYANAAFYQLMGEAYFHSVYSILDDESLVRLQDVAGKLKPGESAELLVHIKVLEVKAFISLLLKDNDEFEIKLCPAGQMLQLLENGQLDREYYRTLLSILGSASFEYDSKENILKLYWINREQDVVFFKGTLNDWMADCIANDKIYKEDMSLFMDFCKDLKENTSRFNYTIRNNILSKNGIHEVIHISGNSLVCNDGRLLTIGTWTIYNSVTGEREDTLLQEIYLDALTGIMLRADVESYARKQIAQRPIPEGYRDEKFPEKSVAICLVDIDNFKSVNDTYGHRFGDVVLKEVAAILMKAAGTKGVPARIGGDEFMMVLEDIKDELELRNILRVVRSGFQWLYPDKLKGIHFGCSIGVSMYPQDAKDYESLFNIADNALYLAKAKGKNRYVIYDIYKHGQLSGNDFDLALVHKEKIRHDMVKVGNLVKEMICDGEAGIPSFLKKLSDHFSFDRVQVFVNEFSEAKYYYCNEGYTKTEADLMKDRANLTLFKGGNYSAVSNIHELEYAQPEIYKVLISKHIESLFQYLMLGEDNEVLGVITFDVCKRPVIWDEDVIDSLILICSVLEALCLS
ncbi:MAG: GGDEF domain-containing protein [Lachnospiraceae bacterium]|nr:GGDEF domain-containing protein [Lachnospiraceae bacterium]